MHILLWPDIYDSSKTHAKKQHRLPSFQFTFLLLYLHFSIRSREKDFFVNNLIFYIQRNKNVI